MLQNTHDILGDIGYSCFLGALKEPHQHLQIAWTIFPASVHIAALQHAPCTRENILLDGACLLGHALGTCFGHEPPPASPSHSPSSLSQVGDNLFVHAGLLPEHVRAGAAAAAAGEGAGRREGEGQSAIANAEDVMRKLNLGASSWLLGNGPPPEELLEPEGPVWTRVYSDPDCRDIDQTARAKLEEVQYGECGVVCRGLGRLCDLRGVFLVYFYALV